MKHLLKKSLAVSSAVAPLAHAVIVPTNVDTMINLGETLFIDFSTGEASTDNELVTMADGWLTFGVGHSEKPLLQFSNADYQASTNGNYVARYDFGAALNFDTTRINSSYFEFNRNGPWNADTAGNVGYAALQNTATSKEMWLAIDYVDTAKTLKLISFAFADTADDIVAGQVPEPAETGALMALAAGSVALYRSRKNRLALKKSA